MPQNVFRKKTRKKGVTGEGFADISVLIESVLSKTQVGEYMDFQTISEHFQEVVGEAVFAHVKPVGLEKRTLVLKVASSAWRSEIFLQKNAIIDKCNSLLGKPLIQAIRFV